MLSNWDAFLQVFATMVGDLYCVCFADAALQKLRQRQGAATSYSAHFQQLMADDEWTEQPALPVLVGAQ